MVIKLKTTSTTRSSYRYASSLRPPPFLLLPPVPPPPPLTMAMIKIMKPKEMTMSPLNQGDPNTLKIEILTLRAQLLTWINVSPKLSTPNLTRGTPAPQGNHESNKPQTPKNKHSDTHSDTHTQTDSAREEARLVEGGELREGREASAQIAPVLRLKGLMLNGLSQGLMWLSRMRSCLRFRRFGGFM